MRHGGGALAAPLDARRARLPVRPLRRPPPAAGGGERAVHRGRARPASRRRRVPPRGGPHDRRRGAGARAGRRGLAGGVPGRERAARGQDARLGRRGGARGGGAPRGEWGRSLALPGVESRPWQLAGLAVVWLAMALPVLRAATLRPGRLDLALLGVRVALLAGLRGSYGRRGPAFWLSPLADPATAACLTLGALRPRREWRGRTYP